MKTALEKVRGENFEVLCETIKKTAFKVTRVGQLVAQEASKLLNIPFGIVDLSLAPTPQSVTVWQTFSAKSAWSMPEHLEQRQHLHC